MIDLLKYRKERKLNQKKISDLTGLDQSVISKYENKKHVTDYITSVLVEQIPELENYEIPDPDYSSGGEHHAMVAANNQQLMETLKEIVKSNYKLIENNAKLVETNALLSSFLVELRKS